MAAEYPALPDQLTPATLTSAQRHAANIKYAQDNNLDAKTGMTAAQRHAANDLKAAGPTPLPTTPGAPTVPGDTGKPVTQLPPATPPGGPSPIPTTPTYDSNNVFSGGPTPLPTPVKPPVVTPPTVPITYQPYTGPTAPGLAVPAAAPPPTYTAPGLVLPESLKPMTAEELAQDPSYQFRLNQGIQALENSNAAAGLSRTGGSYKGLIDYAGGAASQEFAAADARRNATYDRGVDAASRTYTAAAEGASAEFAPLMTGWQQTTTDAQRNAELAFDRGWQQEIYGKDDWRQQQQFNADQSASAKDEDYRRMVFMADDNFRQVVYGTDDAFRKAVAAESDVWKRTVMLEERKKWEEEMRYKWANPA